MARLASIPVVLPDEQHQRTQCVDCVRQRLEGRRGILRVEVTPGENNAQYLQLDYDPKLVTLAALQREVEQARGCLDPNIAHLLLKVEGMHSVDAERAIERQLFGLPSVSASASYSSGTLRLEFDRRKCPLPEIVRRLDRLGYRTASRESSTDPLTLSRKSGLVGRMSNKAPTAAGVRTWIRSHAELSLVLLGGLFLVAGFGVSYQSTSSFDFWNILRVALIVLSAICTSTETFPEAMGYLKRFRLDVDVLMFAAAIGAAALGKFEEGALLLFLFGLGSAGEHLALSRARASIEALTKIAPETAVLLSPDGTQKEVPVKEVSEGDRVLVKPFERVAVDGIVEDGTSAVDQAAVTGESVPVEKSPGADVFAGTMNTSGRLVVRCTKGAGKSTLARIIQLVEEAQSTKSSTQVFTDKVEHYYVPIVFVVTAFLIVLPPLLTPISWGIAFYRSMAFLTAASPCALAIGTPAAVLCAIARAAKIGILIKGGVHLEGLGSIRSVALDKTGTLTTGKLSITELHVVPGTSESELLTYAACVESSSTHPLATAIVAHAKSKSIDPPHAENVDQIAASGIKGTYEGKQIFAGKPAHAQLPRESQEVVERLKAEGKALVAVSVNGVGVGLVALSDTLRPNAKEVIAKLHALGIKHVAMLTGDHGGAAKTTAASLGLDAVHADLLPEDKLKLINEMSTSYGPVAMIGDGVNDAPALAQAAVGIAMGGAASTSGGGGGSGASDVAMETADVVLLSDDLNKLPAALSLGKRTKRIVAQNLVIALGVISIVAPLSALGFTKLSVAVLLHEGSTIVVVLNSLRLLGKGKNE